MAKVQKSTQIRFIGVVFIAILTAILMALSVSSFAQEDVELVFSDAVEKEGKIAPQIITDLAY